jgi:endoglucanase
MNLPLLTKLTEAHGVPGQEDAIRDIVRAELKGVCDISVDTMGNMHCVKAPTKKGKDAKKLMLAAQNPHKRDY